MNVISFDEDGFTVDSSSMGLVWSVLPGWYGDHHAGDKVTVNKRGYIITRADADGTCYLDEDI